MSTVDRYRLLLFSGADDFLRHSWRGGSAEPRRGTVIWIAC